jgi:hypothetical protein
MNISEKLEINYIKLLNAARSNNINQVKKLIIQRDVIFLKEYKGDSK